MKNKGFLIIIPILAFIGAGFFGWKIFSAMREYKQGNDIYSEIASLAYSTEVPAEQDIPGITPTEKIEKTEVDLDIPTSEPEIDETAEFCSMQGCSEQLTTPETMPTAALIRVPTLTLPSPTPRSKSVMNFDQLKSVNNDVKAWIHLEDSKVDYPILQYKDNDYYLHHAITGEWNKVGTPYIDFRCAGDFSDPLTVVYGHYMENGTMFTDFHKYKGQKYFEEHPVIDLYTPDGDYDILPIAGVFQNVEYWDFTLDFESDAAFMHYIDNWKAVSTFKTDTPYNADDRFIVLTLCTYDIENGRYMLIGKLVPREMS